MLYLLKCRICGEAPYVGKAKTKFRARFNNYESAQGPLENKVKYHSSVFLNIDNIVKMGLTIDSSH